MKRLDWFPDWSGDPVVIVASGPSAGTVDLSPAKGRARFVALNTSYRLCPWADMVYGCDSAWWISENGLPGFAGLRVCGSPRAPQMFEGIRHVEVEAHLDQISMRTPGIIGSGGNSGFQAINLMAQFGVKRIILVGYDVSTDAGLHWHGKHPAGLNNPNSKLVQRWRKAIDGAHTALSVLGVSIYNANPESGLQAYQKMSFQDAVENWCT